MYDTTLIEQVLEDIECHLTPLSGEEQEFVWGCRRSYQADCSLSEETVNRLFELLDELDERMSSSSFDDDWNLTYTA